MAASASSEGLGKTIALVVFVILTVVLGVVAFYFYDQVDGLTQERNSANSAAQQARSKENVAVQGFKSLLRLTTGEDPDIQDSSVFFNQGDPTSGISTATKAVDEKLQAPDLNEVRKERKQTYKNLLDALTFTHDEIKADDTRISELEGQLASANQEIEALREKYNEQVDEITKDRDSKAAELLAQTSQFQTTIAQRDEEIAAVAAERLRALNARQDAEQALENFRAEAERENRKLTDLLAEKDAQERLRQQIEFVQTDGKVTEVSLSGRNTQAYINLGSEDGLTKGTTFGVYGLDEGGNPYKLPKANLEVTRIIGPHRALADVTPRDFTNPVLRGDLLYNPLWSPGDFTSIGLVGIVYLDDRQGTDPSNTPQGETEEFIDIAQRLGAKIDAVYDLKSEEIRGNLDINTDWLVIAEIPQPSESDTQVRKDFLNKLRRAETQLRRQAQENDIRVINVRNFLTFMGKQQPRRTVFSGEEYKYLYGKKRPELVDPAPVPPNSREKKDQGGGP